MNTYIFPRIKKSVWQLECSWSDMRDGSMRDPGNWADFLGRTGADPKWIVQPTKLEHGAKITRAFEPGEIREHQSGAEFRCDGLITDVPGLTLAVPFADCPSVVIFAPEQGEFVLLHAGWRGIAARIIEAGVDYLVARGAHPMSLQVFIGPGVRSCCYEVDVSVAEKVVGPGVVSAEAKAKPETGNKVMLDLATVIGARLFAKGVELEDIESINNCTSCYHYNAHPLPYYHSFRRQKKQPVETNIFTARMLLR